ncbi:hypothetical protein PMZ80_003778 [Knufia obscura]|uniref:DUF7730 domain-containing protein n=1 Tax=Knufia obscura TaxID=1635080 RepID=A0ABR0RV60_9EURO|nr:hypothetical protein PMZ80_003778 [Knufia obscura]
MAQRIGPNPGANDTSVGTSEIPVIDTTPFMSASPQQQSTLMRLPAEIRLMILHELLVSTLPIAKRQQYLEQGFQPTSEKRKRNARGQFSRKTANYVTGQRLNPAILLTCQNLLLEGWDLLYHENTLSIALRSSNSIDYNDHRCHSCTFVYALEGKCIFRGYGSPKKFVPGLESFLSRFKRFHIDYNVGPDRRLYSDARTMVIALGQVLAGASVSIDPIGQSMSGSDVEVRRRLNIFQLLRSKAFDIITTSVSQDVVKEIRQIVTSDQTIVDLLPTVDQLHDARYMMFAASRSDGGGSGQDLVRQIFDELDDAARDFDKTKFDELRKQIVDKYDEGVASVRQRITEGLT